MSIKYRRDLFRAIRIPGNGAEIGVAEGNFSEDMLNWPVQFPTFYMVDRWQSVRTQSGDASMPQSWHESNFERVVERTRKFGDRAVILRGDSDKMSFYVRDHSLALLYIDGDHSYEGVIADLSIWVPKVLPGGVVALHDYLNTNYGVNRAVEQFCRTNGYTVYVLEEDKPEDAGAWFYVNPV